MKRKLKLIILFLTSILVVQMIYNLYGDKLYLIDDFIYNQIVKLSNPYVTNFFKVITWFGSAYVILLILLLTLVWKRKYLYILTLDTVLITISNQLLKHIFQRSRPVDIGIIEEVGYSFPSGHAMVSSALYGLMIYLVFKSSINELLKKIICLLLFVLILLIGMSRIYLGVHYATDVITGFSLSTIFLIIFIKISKNYGIIKKE